MHPFVLILSAAAVALGLSACASPSASNSAAGQAAAEQQAHIRQRIADYEADPQAARASGILKYSVNGQPAYLVMAPCCDHVNYLYTVDGKAVCAPSGGIAGTGDGKCPAGIQPFQPPRP